MVGQSDRRGIGYALAATLFFATAGPVARLAGAGGVSPIAIAFWRVGLGAGLIGLLAVATGRPPLVKPARIPALLGYGAVLGLHFYAYIGSLFATSLDHALVLVNTAPLWAVGLSWLWLREPFPRSKLPGLGLAVVGTALLVGFDPAAPAAHLRGDLLGLGAALAYAAYAVLGRRERTRYPLLTYAFWVYLGAALTLFVISPAATVGAPPPRGAWPQLFLLALLPTTIGHTLFNLAVRHAHAATANLIATQEVSGGMILGWLLLGEAPGATALVAWPLVLAGIGWVIISPRRGVFR